MSNKTEINEIAEMLHNVECLVYEAGKRLARVRESKIVACEGYETEVDAKLEEIHLENLRSALWGIQDSTKYLDKFNEHIKAEEEDAVRNIADFEAHLDECNEGDLEDLSDSKKHLAGLREWWAN